MSDSGGGTRLVELVQHEIDGAATAEESAELRGLLGRDPQARRTLEEFAWLARGLGGMADEPAPADLRRAVMHDITTRSRSARRSGWGIPARLWPGRGSAFRYAWIAAMAVGLGLVAVSWRTLSHIRIDGSAVSGTLLPAPAEGHPAGWTVEAGGVTGTIRTIEDAAGFGIAFDLEGAGPLSVVLRFDAGAARFSGVEGEASGTTQAGDGQVRIAATTGRPFTARFERLGRAGVAIGVRLQRDETVLQEWSMDFPGRQVSR